MKRFFIVFLFVFAILFMPYRVAAYSDENAESIAYAAEADKIKNEYLDSDEINGDKTINVFQKATQIISDALNDGGITVVKSFGAILGVVVLCCVMHSLRFTENPTLDSAMSFVSVLALSGVTYSVMYNLFVYIIASMESLTIAMSSLMPIMATLNAFGGSTAAAAAGSSSLTLFFSVLSIICTKVLLPLLQISFALCLVGAVPSGVELSSVTNLVKSTGTLLMSFVFSLLGFTLYLQNAIAAASDNYVTRSIRFASGVFVPVIGNMLGDAARTVIASVSIVKGTVGASGVVIVLSAVIPPFVAVVLHKFMLLGCGIVAKTLGCERESGFLYNMLGITNLLMSLVAGAGVVSMIAIAVFIKTGVTV